ncbi:unnamed protein product [Closterium sp. NIES-53]
MISMVTSGESMAANMNCVVKARRAHSRPQYLSRWRPEEDSTLLDHVMEHGTTQWGLLQRSGMLPGRDNKACCNRFILLRRKFMRQKRSRGSAMMPPAATTAANGIPDSTDSHGSAGSGVSGNSGSSAGPLAPQESSSPLRPSLQPHIPRSVSFPNVQFALQQPSPGSDGGMSSLSAGMPSPQPGMLQWSPLSATPFAASMTENSLRAHPASPLPHAHLVPSAALVMSTQQQNTLNPLDRSAGGPTQYLQHQQCESNKAIPATMGGMSSGIYGSGGSSSIKKEGLLFHDNSRKNDPPPPVPAIHKLTNPSALSALSDLEVLLAHLL